MLNLVVREITTGLYMSKALLFQMYVQLTMIRLTEDEFFLSRFDGHSVCPMHRTSVLRALTIPQSALPSI